MSGVALVIISPSNSSRVQVGLRKESNISITPNDTTWSVTYDAVCGADQAPLATIDPISGDTGLVEFVLQTSGSGSDPTVVTGDVDMSDGYVIRFEMATPAGKGETAWSDPDVSSTKASVGSAMRKEDQ